MEHSPSVKDERRVTTNCTTCDKQIEVPESYFEIYLGTCFCSIECEQEFIEEWSD